MSVNPFSLSNIFLLLISAVLLGYLFILWQLVKQKAPVKQLPSFRKPVLRFAAAYAIYLLLLCVLASTHFFTVITMPPRFLLVFLPMLLIIFLLSKAKLNGALLFLSYLSPVLLVAVQVYRIFIELVFVQFANEKIIPQELSVYGRNFDLWIGVLAIPVAVLFVGNHPLARKAGIAFNILGLLSLANIFSIAVPSMPSTFRVYDMLYLPTYFPGILIVFAASVAIYLHILSLRQLLAMRQTAFFEKAKTKKGDLPMLPSRIA
jgi:hypothetical protein